MSVLIQSIYEFSEYRIETGEQLLRHNETVVPLQPKAIGLLFVFLESGGRILTKEELMELVWVDAFVEEGNLSHNVFLLRKALTNQKGEKFIETIPRRGYRFLVSVRKTTSNNPITITRERKTARIVIEEEIELPNSWLIGREREITIVKNLLRRPDTQILTLTGVGGAGKTSLARAVLQELSNDFVDGEVFVDLSAVRNPSQVISIIAQNLEIEESNDENLLAKLKTFLNEREFLLLLDNFEQVLDAAPQIAQIISLRSKIFITSRSRLHLSVEREFQVPPLALPQKENLPEELIEGAAVRLFVERAQKVKRNFQLTDENALTVADICRRLEGLPLAIELAAARVRLMSPPMILARLENQLDLLTGGARDLPFRQQTMRATIAWSYDLLQDEEKRIFERLSVFTRGFTLTAAEKVVCETEEEFEIKILDAVDSLLDNNLIVRIDEAADEVESRFRMLEVVAEFARERLAVNDKTEKTERLHAKYFLSKAEEFNQLEYPTANDKWFAVVKAEQDNFRKTFRFWLAQDAETALRLAVALHLFWVVNNNFAEGRAALTEVLEKTGDEPTVIRGLAFKAVGMIAWKQGDYQSAREFYTRTLEIAEFIKDNYLTVVVGNGLGTVAYLQNELDAARAYFENVLPLSRAPGFENLCHSILTGLAEVFRMKRDYAQARRLNEETLELAKKYCSIDALIGSYINLGILSYLEDNYSEAENIL